MHMHIYTTQKAQKAHVRTVSYDWSQRRLLTHRSRKAVRYAELRRIAMQLRQFLSSYLMRCRPE